MVWGCAKQAGSTNITAKRHTNTLLRPVAASCALYAVQDGAALRAAAAELSAVLTAGGERSHQLAVIPHSGYHSA
jgi:hypothetical protein